MLRVKRILLLASSAVMYGLALIMSPSLWWGSFVCFTPLLYLGSKERLSFWEGCFYGGLLWGIGGWGILRSLFSMATGSIATRLLPLIIIMTIQAVVAGIWFSLTSFILKKANVESPSQRITFWIFTTWLYFYWVIHLSLSFFDYWEGYFLLNPLLPFVEHPKLLTALPILGKELLLIILLITNAACTVLFLTRKKYIWAAALATAILPWGTSVYFAPLKTQAPRWIEKVAHLPITFVPSLSLMDSAEQVRIKLSELIKKHPQTELVLFPESSFYRVNLDTSREIAQQWDSSSIGKPINLLLGATKWEDRIQRNTIYWFYDGILQGSFNKRHTMAVTENISWYDVPFLRKIFHGKMQAVLPSDNPRVPLALLPDVSFIPYICSELFFNDKPDDRYSHLPMVTLSNDFWANSHYIRHLMFLAARFKAIEWQRPNVYVSYYYSGYLDTHGTIVPIA